MFVVSLIADTRLSESERRAQGEYVDAEGKLTRVYAACFEA